MVKNTAAAKGDEGHTKEMREYYLVDALRAALKHPGLDSDTKSKLQAINRMLTNGNELLVTYAKNNKQGWGRLYARKGLGLQMLTTDVRNAICGSKVHDMDMENAHPNFTLQLSKKHGWACSYLERLCSKREEVLQQIQDVYDMSRLQAKTVLLKILYLGGLPLVGSAVAQQFEQAGLVCGQNDLEHPDGEPQPAATEGTSDCSDQAAAVHEYLSGLQAQLPCIAANVAAAFPEFAKEAARQRKAKKKVTGHPLATAMALVISDIENKALLSMVAALEKAGRRVTTLIYDGLHVRRLEGEEQLPADLLRACEAAVKEDTGYTIRLVQKPMKTTLELGELVAPAEDIKSPFAWCRDILLAAAKEQGLVRMQNRVWGPVPGTACGFQCLGQEASKYNNYINALLREEEAYHEKPETHKHLLTYLECFDHPDFPMAAGFDRTLISFRNGTYILPEDAFVPHGSPEAKALSGRIARHHIDAEFTGSIATPKLDKVLSFQLEQQEVRDWYMAFLGRLQYQVNEKDTWQIMFYTYGLANTGKSLVLKVAMAAFRPGAVACLSGNSQEKFGLQKLAEPGVEVIVCMDMPSNKPADSVMAQEDFQKIVSGEPTNINVKHGKSENGLIPWHMAFAGNNYLRFQDVNGNITRRVGAFRYENYLPEDQQDGNLEKTIIAEELPALIKRSNQLYLQKAAEHGTKNVWHVLPPYFLDIKQNAAGQVNPLVDFLQAPRPQRDISKTRYYVLFREGAYTETKELNTALKAYLQEHQPHLAKDFKGITLDEMGPLRAMGITKETEYVCKQCGAKHQKGGCDCYHYKNRSQRVRWMNLQLVKVEPYAEVPEEESY
jgi:hypothetical protein